MLRHGGWERLGSGGRELSRALCRIRNATRFALVGIRIERQDLDRRSIARKQAANCQRLGHINHLLAGEVHIPAALRRAASYCRFSCLERCFAGLEGLLWLAGLPRLLLLRTVNIREAVDRFRRLENIDLEHGALLAVLFVLALL